MALHLPSGVDVEEIKRDPVVIEGVSTNTAAFLGQAERGTTQPPLLTSYDDYLRRFGGVFGDHQFLPYAIRAFFENGGRRCYLARIPNANSTVASQDFGDLHIEAAGPGDWGKRVFVKISASTAAPPGAAAATPVPPIGIRLQVAYWAADPMPPDPLPDPFASPPVRLAVPPQ